MAMTIEMEMEMEMTIEMEMEMEMEVEMDRYFENISKENFASQLKNGQGRTM